MFAFLGMLVLIVSGLLVGAFLFLFMRGSVSGAVGMVACASSVGVLVWILASRLWRADPSATVYWLDTGCIGRNSLPVVEPLLLALVYSSGGAGLVLVNIAFGDAATVRDHIQVVVITVVMVVAVIAMPIWSWRAAGSGAHLRFGPDGLHWVTTGGRAHFLSIDELVQAECRAYRNGNLRIAVVPSPAHSDRVLIRLVNYGPNLESVLQALDDYLTAAGGSIQRVNRFR
ncbi:hypothetical protein GIY30_07995 [Gordonia sp. HNM0687]|uniref:Uncharacterized protein n=1 Tax=Gordonia mangrovi TaxID=2665643 RepID=A0A6L7GNW5_9ACTN|nr:hypothetical protein [Gordonia mangrovi]MXP21293.1 hypothetical protein [Gordonia mangrovi]UVF80045.1 hypothetical protein NWF22_09570 [Gordonia mangrovi]